MAEAVCGSGRDVQHGAAAQVELGRGVGAAQEVLGAELLHALQAAPGQLDQGPLGEMR